MHPMTFRRWFAALLLLSLALVPALASALFEDDLLDPDDAFALQAEAIDGDLLRLTWTIADGYYMYREQFRFTPESEGLEFGGARIPDGTVKEDEFFGRVETYRDRIEIELPVVAAASKGIELTARSQGCADIGVCYPPHFQTVSLNLPELPAAQPAAPAGNGRNALDALARLSGGFNDEDELLEPEVAFAASARAISQNAVVLRFDIAEGYYLYRDKLGFRIAEGEGIELGPVNPPDGTLIVDEFFGETEIYRDSVEILVPVLRSADDVAEIVLAVDYQGCADLGVCYPPLTQDVTVAFAAGLADEAEELPATGTVPPAADDPGPVTEQDRIAAQLADGRIWLVALAFFGFGLLLTFTPCVFPMIPILSNIIIGQKNLTTRKAFFISLAFVLAMALTYTLAGVFAGLAGANLQAAFQNPWIIGGFVLVFIALALSMFGFYELQMPSGVQSRLTNISNRQQGGTLVGAAIMGFLAALIVGPCVTAPLVGALLYISQTGDAVLGGIALFALSMGMGAPLLAIGTSAGKILPKAGPWMDTVKAVFGVGLLAMGVWLLERVIPGEVALLLWATLFIVTAIYMGALQTLPEGASGWHSLWKGLGLVLLLYGVILMLGAFTGGKDMFRPLAELRAPAALVGTNGAPRVAQMEFGEVDSLADVEREVAEAAGRNQPVFLDFYADWCVDCVRMERTTFRDPRVIQAMSEVHLLKADVTANTTEHRDLMRAFNLFGPPAMIFYDHDGEELRHRRVVGYLNAERFLAHVEQSIGARP
ncbi:Cytochrome c-type biogenesis protein DsbD, protein-disulfide reductase [Thioalkalivibrio nitratireducens DSM 14787]|uniref:Thiol:disulfide interchange protein DsbD n=1 Tax=Thioalkalivibrio nitratireducens (strain DSM 14787 / UNIQEM 213 / ALEN2) TaxID=1255043 RepID=L0DRG2_THIND|nr:protein-disulfide reductase DsbD [Thioalkalivibrio nitratireducens]AGA32179.1 Cytochrome c-type biogenesis protein DsbD, protein-disulfide reductase [Thioalkalivibrio nitratireducens DSM 14787]